MASPVVYGAASSVGPSDFWSDCPWGDIDGNPSLGWKNYLEGGNMPSLAAGTDDFPGLAYFLDTGDTTVAVAGLGLASYGSILTAATDNNGPVLSLGGLSSARYQITVGTTNKLWFEACIASSSAVFSDHAMFIGLAGQETATSLVANNGVLTDDTGALISTGLNAIGFHAPAGTGIAAVLSAVHMKTAHAVVTNESSVLTPATGTFYKVGFKYDPNDDTLRYFVSGAETTRVTASGLGTTTFPSAKNMSPVLALKAGAAAVKNLHFKWIRAAQLA